MNQQGVANRNEIINRPKRPEVSISLTRPVAGTIVEQIFFLSKNIGYIKLYPMLFDRETTGFQFKLVRSQTIEGSIPMISIILVNPSGQTAEFILDSEKRKLQGYYRSYSLAEAEVAVLKTLMDDLGIL